MSTTTMTTTTTTMMTSIDIPSSDEVVGVAATSDAGATSLPAPAPALSFFALGEKHDRVLEVFSEMGLVRMTLTTQVKFVSLTTKRWALLMWVRDEINVVVKEIKRYNTGLYLVGLFWAHWRLLLHDGNCHVWYGCVDI